MKICTKRFAEIPFAHRQHSHPGHCSLVHGHNWTFEITFSADTLDRNGFVLDFGSLGPVKEWLASTFDHKLVLSTEDHSLDFFLSQDGRLWSVTLVPDASAEGLAQFVCQIVNTQVRAITNGRAHVACVTVFEDSRNSATYTPDERAAS